MTTRRFKVAVKGKEYVVRIVDGTAQSVSRLGDNTPVWTRSGKRSPSRDQWTAISEALRAHNGRSQ